MLEWINKTFGIENEVSVPTFISLIVFVTGGSISYIYNQAKSWSFRRNNRKTFFLIVNEVIKDLKIKESQMSIFYPKIRLSYLENWVLPFTTIGYLETIFELNFNEIYTAFRKKIILNSAIKNKAFHTVWAVLRNIKYLEENLPEAIKSLEDKFEIKHTLYGEMITQYSSYRDELARETMHIINDGIDKEVISYIGKLSKIWNNWMNLGEERAQAYYTYNNLVKPALELNREFPNLDLTIKSTEILMQCTYHYMDMDNILITYQRHFRNYYLSYRNAHRTLLTCLKILKSL